MTSKNIPQQDRKAAADYLTDRMTGLKAPDWAANNLQGGFDSLTTARKELGAIRNQGADLNAWCARWLTDGAWHRLRNALRQRRHHRANPRRDVRMPAEVADRLDMLADQWGLSRGEAVEAMLQHFEAEEASTAV